MRSPISREELLYVIPAFAILLTVHLQLLPFCADDAYIHFRIAENFLATGSPYFNLGQAVMATSSTLWTLLLSVIFLIVGVSPFAAAIANSIITVSAGIVYARLATTLLGKNSLRLSASAFLITLTTLISSSIQLMEIPLAMLLLGCGLLAYFRGKSSAFIFLILAIFTRLEMLVFFAVILVENGIYRRIPWRDVLFKSFVAAVPLVAFDLYFFGTLIPQTVIAKSALYDLSASEFLTFAAAGLLGKYIFYNFPFVVLVFFTLLTTVTIYFCLLHLHPPDFIRRDRRILIPLVGGMLLFLAYAFRKVYIFPWYVPLYSLPIFFALLFSAFTKKSTPLKLLITLLVLPGIFSFFRDVVAGIWDPQFYSEYEGGLRALAYRNTGVALARSCPTCKLMAAEIGALGFGFRGTVVDAAGLASPDAVKYHLAPSTTPKHHMGGTIPLEFVREVKPELIVGMKSFFHEIAESDVAQEYHLQNVELKPPSALETLGEPLQVMTRKK